MMSKALALALAVAHAVLIPEAITLTATATGVDGESLADTPMTDAINMHSSWRSNQLSLNLAITPGTTTRFDVRCYESADGTNYGQIPLCDAETPSTCVPDVRRFTLADWTADGNGDKHITTRWHVTKAWVKCSVDDPDDGDGTVIITGERSWQ